MRDGFKASIPCPVCNSNNTTFAYHDRAFIKPGFVLSYTCLEDGIQFDAEGNWHEGEWVIREGKWVKRDDAQRTNPSQTD